MKRFLTATAIIASLAVMALPATAEDSADDIAVQGTGKAQTTFGTALLRDYYDLAEDRTQIGIHDEDWLYFLGKGAAAREGYLVIPEPMNARSLDVSVNRPLQTARTGLMKMLEGGGRDLVPNEASKA